MQRHIRIEKAPVRCSDCNEVMPEILLLKHKREECVNKNRVGGPVYKKPRLIPRGVKVAKTAFNKMLINNEIENNNETTDLIVFLEAQRFTVQEIIKHDSFVKNAIKMNMALRITIENVAGEVSPWAFRTSNVEIYFATPINGIITDMFEKIKQKTSKNNPLRVSSYLMIPEKFKFHRAFVNPYNVNDNECFKWSVCASQHNGLYPERITNLFQYVDRFKWEDVQFPTAIVDVRKFERINLKEALAVHKKHCATFPIAKVELPQTRVKEDGQPIKPIIQFKNIEHSEKVPIVIYVDFESYLPKVQGCTKYPEKSSTTVVQEHVPIFYGFYVVSTLPPEVMTEIPLDYQTFEGADAARHFLDALEDISIKVYKLYKRKQPMNLAREDGSKEITIGLDPALDFTPVITIGRGGWSGFRMSVETFSVLCSYGNPLLEYFDNTATKKDPLLLNAMEIYQALVKASTPYFKDIVHNTSFDCLSPDGSCPPALMLNKFFMN
ncbi:hypothetical protein B566_EDAN013347 [Ephemera danica]|nr:hypothetical protein B566_EDAN013347 [Ephemera danica]